MGRLEDEELTFSAPVRLLVPGRAGSLAGWSRNGYYHEITTQLQADDGSLLNNLGAEEGYLDVGGDLVIWTKHFTVYVFYGFTSDYSDVLLSDAIQALSGCCRSQSA